MTDLIIYGASDDLIETEGLLREEFGAPYDKPALVTVLIDDTVYTRLHMEYNDEGEWRIQPTSPGDLVQVLAAAGENDDGPVDRDEHGCPSYSDKAIIDMTNVEARRVNVWVEVA